MHNLKRAAFVVLALVLAFGTVIFILENQQLTSISFLGWGSPELPASIFMLGALLLGMVIGPVLGFAVYRRKAARLKRIVLQS